jgi:hypothetical protein
VKPAEARRLAAAHTNDELERAAAALCDEKDPPIEVNGKDHGEKLTHVLLATRIRARMDSNGEELKDAFREIMRGVRDVLTNEES